MQADAGSSDRTKSKSCGRLTTAPRSKRFAANKLDACVPACPCLRTSHAPRQLSCFAARHQPFPAHPVPVRIPPTDTDGLRACAVVHFTHTTGGDALAGAKGISRRPVPQSSDATSHRQIARTTFLGKRSVGATDANLAARPSDLSC